MELAMSLFNNRRLRTANRVRRYGDADTKENEEGNWERRCTS